MPRPGIIVAEQWVSQYYPAREDQPARPNPHSYSGTVPREQWFPGKTEMKLFPSNPADEDLGIKKKKM